MASVYRWSLLLPIVLPLAAPLLWHAMPSEWLFVAAGWLIPSLYVGGLPYLLVVALSLFRIRRYDQACMERFRWRLPIWTACAVMLTTLLATLVDSGGPDALARDNGDAASLVMVVGTMTLAYGYSYVVLVRGFVGVAQWLSARSSLTSG